MPPSFPSSITYQKPLLDWFDRHQRDLPWRHTKDPYAIFISEMMLQQTQVRTVIPYYERFLRELPHWKALAKATEDRVLKLWEGLGYYRRARNLRAAAKMVLEKFDGKLPDSLEAVLELPGVGPYSAGAVLSIAYGKPHPLVDGNVLRVFSRLFLLKGDLKTGEGNRRAWDIAKRLLPEKRPGDFNQALMELGALVCLPDNPGCLICPLAKACGAAQKGLQNRFPQASKAPKTLSLAVVSALVERRGKVLLKRRGGGERWLQGLWEFPSAEGKNHQEARLILEKSLGGKLGAEELSRVRHQITHHKIEIKLFKADLPARYREREDFRWVAREELAQYALPSAHSKLRQWLLGHPGEGPSKA